MKEYDVKITETLEKTVTVEAESRDAAEEQVKKPSVLAQLKKFKEMVAAIPKKVREKKQERDL